MFGFAALLNKQTILLLLCQYLRLTISCVGYHRPSTPPQAHTQAHGFGAVWSLRYTKPGPTASLLFSLRNKCRLSSSLLYLFFTYVCPYQTCTCVRLTMGSLHPSWCLLAIARHGEGKGVDGLARSQPSLCIGSACLGALWSVDHSGALFH